MIQKLQTTSTIFMLSNLLNQQGGTRQKIFSNYDNFGQGMIKYPTKNGLIVDASHAATFSANIISVGLQSHVFQVIFSNSDRDSPYCFLF